MTHRAIDAEADAPRGTTSNYFPTRDAIVDAIIARIGQRLAPDPAVHVELAARPPGRALFTAYLQDIVRRLTVDKDAAIALFELRLESSRRPQVAAAISAWLHAGLEGDITFNREAGLPGDRDDIILFHYALDGLILDQLTVPIDPTLDVGAVVDTLVQRLLPQTHDSD